MNREQLIARKHAVQQQLRQAQRRLEAAHLAYGTQMGGSEVNVPQGWLAIIRRWAMKGLRGPRAHQAKVIQLQRQIDLLMMEEYRLRCTIDQSQK